MSKDPWLRHGFHRDASPIYFAYSPDRVEQRKPDPVILTNVSEDDWRRPSRFPELVEDSNQLEKASNSSVATNESRDDALVAKESTSNQIDQNFGDGRVDKRRKQPVWYCCQNEEHGPFNWQLEIKCIFCEHSCCRFCRWHNYKSLLLTEPSRISHSGAEIYHRNPVSESEPPVSKNGAVSKSAESDGFEAEVESIKILEPSIAPDSSTMAPPMPSLPSFSSALSKVEARSSAAVGNDSGLSSSILSSRYLISDDRSPIAARLSEVSPISSPVYEEGDTRPEGFEVFVKPSFKCTFRGCTAPPFQTQYILNSHANVHSASRQHFCPVKNCPRGIGGKGFIRKNEMIRHGLIHDSPGYVCPFCPDQEHKYPRPDNLQRHVRVWHVDKDRDDPLLREVLAQTPDRGSRGRLRKENPKWVEAWVTHSFVGDEAIEVAEGYKNNHALADAVRKFPAAPASKWADSGIGTSIFTRTEAEDSDAASDDSEIPMKMKFEVWFRSLETGLDSEDPENPLTLSNIQGSDQRPANFYPAPAAYLNLSQSVELPPGFKQRQSEGKGKTDLVYPPSILDDIRDTPSKTISVNLEVSSVQDITLLDAFSKEASALQIFKSSDGVSSPITDVVPSPTLPSEESPINESFAADLGQATFDHSTPHKTTADRCASEPTVAERSASTPAGSDSVSKSSLSTPATSVLGDEYEDYYFGFADQHEGLVARIAKVLISSWGPSSLFGSNNNVTAAIQTHGSNGKESSTRTRQVPQQCIASSSNSRDLNVNSSPFRRQRDTEDEDGEDGDDPPRKRAAKGKKVSRADPRSNPLLACPFFKFDPRRYSERNEVELSYRSCCSAIIRTIPILKQHLHRNHARPRHYCWRCFDIFKTAQDAGAHQRQALQCTLKECSFPERMTEEQAETIQQRNIGINFEKKWYDIYRTLFPTAVLPPSPYIDNGLDSQLQDFLGHFQRYAPEIVRAEMAELGHVSSDEEERIMMAALDRALSSIMQRWWRDHARHSRPRDGQGAPDEPEPLHLPSIADVEIDFASVGTDREHGDAANPQSLLPLYGSNAQWPELHLPDNDPYYLLDDADYPYVLNDAPANPAQLLLPTNEIDFATALRNENLPLPLNGSLAPIVGCGFRGNGLSSNRNEIEIQSPERHGQYYSLSPNGFSENTTFNAVDTSRKMSKDGNNLDLADWHSESWDDLLERYPAP